MRRWRSAGLVVLGCLGCSATDDSPFPTASPAAFSVRMSVPTPDAQGVATDASLLLLLTQPMYPEFLANAWTLRTGPTVVTGTLILDLVTPSVRVRAARGLLPGLVYELSLGAGGSGLASFDGVPLAPFTLRFQTHPDPQMTTPSTPVRVATATEAAQALVQGGCTASGCHRGDRPPFGLALDTGDALASAAARRSQGDPARPLVTPGNHARSYLMWKALGLARTVGHRRHLLAPDQARVLADWIDQGAMLP